MNPLNKILLGIGATLALAIAVVFVWLSLANAHLKTQLAQAQANATACHLANDEFTVAVARQNAAIEKLQTQGAARAKQARLAAYRTQEIMRAYERAAAKIGETNPRGHTCKAAENLFDTYLSGVK